MSPGRTLTVVVRALVAVMMLMRVTVVVAMIMAMVMRVVVSMVVAMRVTMMVMLVRICILERRLTTATAADGTHYSTSSSLTFISSPPTTCS